MGGGLTKDSAGLVLTTVSARTADNRLSQEQVEAAMGGEDADAYLGVLFVCMDDKATGSVDVATFETWYSKLWENPLTDEEKAALGETVDLAKFTEFCKSKEQGEKEKKAAKRVSMLLTVQKGGEKESTADLVKTFREAGDDISEEELVEMVKLAKGLTSSEEVTGVGRRTMMMIKPKIKRRRELKGGYEAYLGADPTPEKVAQGFQKEDMVRTAASMGEPMDPAEADELFASLDKDKDGYVNFKEFQSAMAEEEEEEEEEES